ncbi:hypothetical protein [Bradyrhizobium septentrionale]|uniref:Uncharacterized protein n=1 Tax=Bradyrhizobium septentrionale TaxID=1404411 RepID=A0A974A1W5_9BRAD|nr:hypothetical protein [Bradyrhizobium septentrionale]UGY13862.1 hypothetical protein HAP48_0035630 [Bradyrhizobium septentrionale]UGY22414.1 hypothetical protein HU675_0031120 [Bradyrhizobium septentrionale]
MIAPDKLWIGWSLIGTAALGGIGLGLHHFGRKFFVVPVTACGLWWNYWYYTNALRSIEPIKPTSIVSDTPAPAAKPVAVLQPAKPRLISTNRAMILACDKPKPEKPQSRKERQADLDRYLDLMRKIIGLDVKGSLGGDDEIRLQIFEQTSPLIVVKSQSYLLKRVGDQLYVRITKEFVEGDFVSIVASLSVNPDDPAAKETATKIEQLTHSDPGKCKFL